MRPNGRRRRVLQRDAARPSAVEPAESRRSEIRGIAASLFVLKGFDGTTMREIAAAAGVLPGSLYHHFASKEEILHEIMKPFLRRTLGDYRAIVRRGARPAVALPILIEAALTLSLAEPATHAILVYQWASMSGNPHFAYVARNWQETHQIWSKVIQAGVNAGEFRAGLDIDLTTHLVLEQISSTVFWAKFKRNDPAEVARAHITILMNGLLSR